MLKVLKRLDIHYLAYRFARKHPWVSSLLRPSWNKILSIKFLFFSSLWQIRKLLPLPVDIKYFGGNLYLLPYGQIMCYLWSGNFEAGEKDFISRFLKEDMFFINAGSNIGLYAVMASKIIGKPWSVLAIEPSSESYNIMLQNIRINSCPDIYTIQCAVSRSSGSGLLFKPVSQGNFPLDAYASLSQPKNSKLLSEEQVNIYSLDSLVMSSESPVHNWNRNQGISTSKWIFLLIDVESHEFDVLKGSDVMLRSLPNLIAMIEVTKDVLRTHNLMASYGFQPFFWDRWAQFLHPMPLDNSKLSTNCIYIRPDQIGAVNILLK